MGFYYTTEGATVYQVARYGGARTVYQRCGSAFEAQELCRSLNRG